MTSVSFSLHNSQCHVCRDSVDVDFQAYSAGFTLGNVLQTAHRFPEQELQFLVEIRNKRVTFKRRTRLQVLHELHVA